MFLFLSIFSFLFGNPDPVVVVAISDESFILGVKDAIELGWADGGASVPFQYKKVDGTAESMRAVAQEMVDRYPDRNLILFAGAKTSELKAAAEVFGISPKRLVISSGSTIRKLPPGTASSAPSHEVATMAAHLYAQSMNCSGVAIAYIQDPYVEDYLQSFTEQAKDQQTKIIALSPLPKNHDKQTLKEALQPTLKALQNLGPNGLLLWLNTADDLESLSDELQKLPLGTRVLCSDLADGVHDRFGTVPVSIIIPSILDNTPTTADVTQRLYANNKKLIQEQMSWAVWNSYDGARIVSSLVKAKIPVNLQSLSIKHDGAFLPAALGTGWFDVKLGRPNYGLHWIVNAQDKTITDLPAFRDRVKGAVFTLPNSAGCVGRIGNVPWLGTFSWWAEIFCWQQIAIPHHPMILKHSAEIYEAGDFLISNIELHIPLFLEGKKLNGFVIDPSVFAPFNFPYPLSTYKWEMRN